jgi:hypothetical protein
MAIRMLTKPAISTLIAIEWLPSGPLAAPAIFRLAYTLRAYCFPQPTVGKLLHNNALLLIIYNFAQKLVPYFSEN